MLRFHAVDLRPVLEEAQANQTTVYLVKDCGIYLRAKGGSCQDDGRVVHLAYAVGYRDDAGGGLCEEVALSADICHWVLEEHGDLTVELTATPRRIGTALPVRCFVPVAEYRELTALLFAQARGHYYACRNIHERSSWRSDALRMLDTVVGTDCKRASHRDRRHYEVAFTALKSRIHAVTTDGAILASMR
jgi:hypothetical protein